MPELNEFPFEDAPNTAAFTCRHVLDGAPVLYISHDEDGYWQFLCGGEHKEEDARIVSLYSVYKRCPDVAALAGMPCGCFAECEDEESDWRVFKCI